MIERSWSNIVTVSCILIAAAVEAAQQALSSAPNVKAALPDFAISPKVNYVPLALLIIAGIVWIAAHRRSHVRAPSNAGQSSSPPPNQFLNVDDFYRTYDNVFLREVETLVRQQSDQYKGSDTDRERFLVRFAASTLGVALFEWIWWQIFGSQLRMLQIMNSKPLNFEEARQFYEQGPLSRPDFYKTYTFEQWLTFLRGIGFILETGISLQITIRGREFLKYITHCGYDISIRGG